MLSFDEKGKTPVKHYGGKKWTKEKKYHIPYNQKVKGLFDIVMILNIHTGVRHYRFYDWKNSFIVIDFFEWLLSKVYIDQDVYIILDGWSAHISNMTKAFVDLQPRLHLEYLPTCSSWMNDIERDFSRIQKEVLDNSDFETPRDAITTIDNFIKYNL